MDLPDLGVGVIWFAGLDPLVRASTDLVDFYEVEPATLSLAPHVEAVAHPDGPLAHLATRGKPVVVHGVSCPVGGTVPADNGEEAALAAAADLVGSPWVSEHLSIDRFTIERGESYRPGSSFHPPRVPRP